MPFVRSDDGAACIRRAATSEHMPVLTLIEHGEIYAPERIGGGSILIADDRILHVGEIDRRAVEALGLDVEVVDAAGRVIVPGFIDPHAHIIGGSGEKSYSSRTPAFGITEIVRHGTTTIVGTLGADTTTRTMEGLLAQAKLLKEEGMTAFVWSGGYHIPPATLTGSIRSDLVLIEEVIGAGEIAVSDQRSPQPDPDALMKIIVDAHVGGMLSGKAGVTHFHIGPGRDRMGPLRELFEQYEIEPESVYFTHIERTEELLDEAIELIGRGAWGDIDTSEGELAKWLRCYLEHGGDPERLTVSSDADGTSTGNLYQELVRCVHEHGFRLEEMLPFVTTNTARVLKLPRKGRVAAGMDADLVLMDARSLDITDVLVRGVRMVHGGELTIEDRFLEDSDRTIIYMGKKRTT